MARRGNNGGVRWPSQGRRGRLGLAGQAIAVVLCLLPAWQEFANYGSEHIRFPDQAYQVLTLMRRGAFYAEKARRLNTNPANTFAPLTTAPPGVDAAGWARFTSKALAAP